MAYEKTEWIDHVVDPETQEIIQQGTRFTAQRANKIEQGIEDAHEDIEQLDIDKVNKAGDIMTGPLRTNANGVIDYKNVLHYAGNNVTGILKIKMPKTWSNTRFTMRLQGFYNSANRSIFDLELSGYNVAGSPGYWTHQSAVVHGRSDAFSRVRFGHDGDTCCILLGDIDSFWTYPTLTIETFKAYSSGQQDWESGWSVEFLTDITGITSIVEPNLQYGNIVERGSNTNGEYIRYADGTQICTRIVPHNMNTQNGQTWAFPASFTSVTGVSGGPKMNKTSGTATDAVYWDNLKNITVTWHSSNLWATLTRTTIIDAVADIHLIAIGRWK